MQTTRPRSPSASAQSDQRLSVCCLDSIIIQNFKTLASFCSWADWFESYLVANPEDTWAQVLFTSETTHIIYLWAVTLSSHEILSHSKYTWATSWQNPTEWLCAQRRLRSAWASAQSDQSSLCAQWVAKSLSCSLFHHLKMIEILLKGT